MIGTGRPRPNSIFYNFSCPHCVFMCIVTYCQRITCMLKRIVTLAIPLVIILSVTVVAAQMDPITLPTPTGEYAVSRLDRDLTDESREEIFTEDADDFRRLLVTFYYPAAGAANA